MLSVSERDRPRVITGEEALGVGETRWFGFEAVHVFPLQLAYEGHWVEGRWITIQPSTGGSIYTCTHTCTNVIQLKYVKEVLFNPQIVPHGVISPRAQAYVRVFAAF